MRALLLLLALPVAGLPAQGMQRVRVNVENLAPVQGTFQTPVWVGFHDGGFDLYDRGVTVSGPQAPVGNDALERLAEDGDTSVLAGEFLASGNGTVEGTIPGAAGPYGPGDRGSASFLLDPTASTSRYFSYATMVIPSNDAFLANGDPLAHPVFDASGFVAMRIFSGSVLDAGSEINDEVPANTAFLAQAAPNTGVNENGVVAVHPGFMPAGAGGILDQAMFSQGNFVETGYPTLKIRLEVADAITENRTHTVQLSGDNEVPPVRTNAAGTGMFFLEDGGTRFVFRMFFTELENVSAAHLHMGDPTTNGPVVVDLLAGRQPRHGAARFVRGRFDANDLVGPLDAMPLDVLAAMMEANQIYVNIHTERYPGGELRGQVQLQ